MSFDAWDKVQLLNNIQHEFGFSFDLNATTLAIISEHLRASTVLANTTQPEGVFAAPTIRITAPARNRLAAIWPEFSKEITDSKNLVLSELRKLESLGDVVSVSGGKYLIAPLRFLRIDDSFSLLIGGGPIQLLPRELQPYIQVFGRARILNVDVTCPFKGQVTYQRLEDWLDIPHDDMSVWARRFFQYHCQIANAISEVNDHSLFVSQAWIAISEYQGPEGWFLSRRTVKLFRQAQFEWAISRVKITDSGVPIIVAVSSISSDDGRRLQGSYQIDEMYQPSISYQLNGLVVSVRIPHPLASPEEKLINLGWRIKNSEDPSKWPREYYFSHKLIPLLRRGFALQGYKFIEKSSERNHVAK